MVGMDVVREDFRPIVVLGPTAGGKSELAVALAEQFNGQVLGADSMQVYRQMEAGTAKPSPRLRARVRHHLIDLVEPTQRFTVADWLEQAEAVMGQLRSRGKRAVVVGGTNLYIKALLEGLFDGPGADADFRASLAKVEPGELHRRASAIDPKAAGRIAVADRKRLIRVLEVHHLTGQRLSELQKQWTDQTTAGEAAYRWHPVLIGLQWEPEAINRRINLRVKAMFYPASVEAKLAAEVCPAGESLPEETARLEAAGQLGMQAREALGYKQVLSSLAGEYSMDQASEQTKIQTRRFAKQQRTWLKRFRGVQWIDVAAVGPTKVQRNAQQAVDAAISG